MMFCLIIDNLRWPQDILQGNSTTIKHVKVKIMYLANLIKVLSDLMFALTFISSSSPHHDKSYVKSVESENL